MRMVRAGTLLVCAAGSLLGCAGSRLAPDPPAGLSLAGAWKLDRAASDDPQRVLARMRTEALRRMAQRVVATGTPRGGTRGAPTRTAQPEDPALDGDPVPLPMGHGVPPDPLERSPMARALLASIGRGDFLTVRQSSAELVLDYGNSQRRFTPGAHSEAALRVAVVEHEQRRFTPGAHSVVSAESGVAD